MPSTEKLKLYHVVMREGTVTFLTWAAALEFLGPRPAREVAEFALIVESEVEVEEFNRIARWRAR